MSDILNKALADMLTGQHEVAQKITSLAKQHDERSKHLGQLSQRTRELSEQTHKLSEQTHKLSEQTRDLSDQTSQLFSNDQKLSSNYHDLADASQKQAHQIQAVIDALGQHANTSVDTQLWLNDHEERIRALEDRDAS